MKTNIGIDIRTLMDKQYSGVPEHTLNLIDNILKTEEKEKKGNKYKLFYNSAKDVEERIPRFKSSEVEISKLNYPNKIFNYLLQKTLKYPKIDKILDVNVFLMPHINFAALSPDCRSVLTVHDISFLRYPEFFSARKNFWHYMINVKKMINSFDKLVSVSNNTKHDIIDICGVKEDKVEVVYPGLDKGLYRRLDAKTCEPIKKKYQLKNKFILYIGTLEPRKNIEGLIESFNIFCKKRERADCDLVIAGGKGWKSEKIIKKWKSSEYKGRIKFLGYIPRQDKPLLYNAASVFAYPSFYEGFGFPPLEAMACGTPVLTSFSSSLAEVAGESAFLVDPYNSNKIACYLDILMKDENLRQKLRLEGSETVKKYNWEDTAQNYIELMENLA
ncbi:MAG: glycosyltransferase family 4 protein [Patescibacteria group bacterium]